MADWYHNDVPKFLDLYEKKKGDPLYGFMYDQHADGVAYYNWKVFCVKQKWSQGVRLLVDANTTPSFQTPTWMLAFPGTRSLISTILGPATSLPPKTQKDTKGKASAPRHNHI